MKRKFGLGPKYMKVREPGWIDPGLLVTPQPSPERNEEVQLRRRSSVKESTYRPLEDIMPALLEQVKPRRSGLEVFRKKPKRPSPPQTPLTQREKHAVSTPLHPINEDLLNWNMSRIINKEKLAGQAGSTSSIPSTSSAKSSHNVDVNTKSLVQKRFSLRKRSNQISEPTEQHIPDEVLDLQQGHDIITYNGISKKADPNSIARTKMETSEKANDSLQLAQGCVEEIATTTTTVSEPCTTSAGKEVDQSNIRMNGIGKSVEASVAGSSTSASKSSMTSTKKENKIQIISNVTVQKRFSQRTKTSDFLDSLPSSPEPTHHNIEPNIMIDSQNSQELEQEDNTHGIIRRRKRRKPIKRLKASDRLKSLQDAVDHRMKEILMGRSFSSKRRKKAKSAARQDTHIEPFIVTDATPPEEVAWDAEVASILKNEEATISQNSPKRPLKDTTNLMYECNETITILSPPQPFLDSKTSAPNSIEKEDLKTFPSNFSTRLKNNVEVLQKPIPLPRRRMLDPSQGSGIERVAGISPVFPLPQEDTNTPTQEVLLPKPLPRQRKLEKFVEPSRMVPPKPAPRRLMYRNVPDSDTCRESGYSSNARNSPTNVGRQCVEKDAQPIEEEVLPIETENDGRHSAPPILERTCVKEPTSHKLVSVNVQDTLIISNLRNSSNVESTSSGQSPGSWESHTAQHIFSNNNVNGKDLPSKQRDINSALNDRERVESFQTPDDLQATSNKQPRLHKSKQPRSSKSVETDVNVNDLPTKRRDSHRKTTETLEEKKAPGGKSRPRESKQSTSAKSIRTDVNVNDDLPFKQIDVNHTRNVKGSQLFPDEQPELEILLTLEDPQATIDRLSRQHKLRKSGSGKSVDTSANLNTLSFNTTHAVMNHVYNAVESVELPVEQPALVTFETPEKQKATIDRRLRTRKPKKSPSSEYVHHDKQVNDILLSKQTDMNPAGNIGENIELPIEMPVHVTQEEQKAILYRLSRPRKSKQSRSSKSIDTGANTRGVLSPNSNIDINHVGYTGESVELLVKRLELVPVDTHEEQKGTRQSRSRKAKQSLSLKSVDTHVSENIPCKPVNMNSHGNMGDNIEAPVEQPDLVTVDIPEQRKVTTRKPRKNKTRKPPAKATRSTTRAPFVPKEVEDVLVDIRRLVDDDQSPRPSTNKLSIFENCQPGPSSDKSIRLLCTQNAKVKRGGQLKQQEDANLVEDGFITPMPEQTFKEPPPLPKIKAKKATQKKLPMAAERLENNLSGPSWVETSENSIDNVAMNLLNRIDSSKPPAVQENGRVKSPKSKVNNVSEPPVDDIVAFASGLGLTLYEDDYQPEQKQINSEPKSSKGKKTATSKKQPEIASDSTQREEEFQKPSTSKQPPKSNVKQSRAERKEPVKPKPSKKASAKDSHISQNITNIRARTNRSDDIAFAEIFNSKPKIVGQSRYGRTLKQAPRLTFFCIVTEDQMRKMKKLKNVDTEVYSQKPKKNKKTTEAAATQRRRKHSEVVEVEPMASTSTNSVMDVINTSLSCPKRLRSMEGDDPDCPDPIPVVEGLRAAIPGHITLKGLTGGTYMRDWQVAHVTVEPNQSTENPILQDQLMFGIVINGQGLMRYNCSEVPIDANSKSTFTISAGSYYGFRNPCKKTPLAIMIMVKTAHV